MFANLQQTLILWVREKTGLTASFLILICIAAVTALLSFVFLCVSAYAWAALEVGPVFGGLAVAGVFLAIAAFSYVVATVSRSRAKKRAIRERAARSRRVTPLMDPKMLSMGMKAARIIGWQRLIPFSLLGFLATQLAQERRPASHRSL